MGSCFKVDAQKPPSYNPFDIRLGVGIALPTSGSLGGAVEINPGYTIAGRYRMGVEFGWAGFDEYFVSHSNLSLDYYVVQAKRIWISMGGSFGYCNTSYYLFPSTLPPEQKMTYISSGKLGGNIRAGFGWHRIYGSIGYYFGPDLSIASTYDNYPTTTTLFKGNYFGFTIGIRLFGGLR